MGKIIGYVILLSNLSLILRAAQYKDAPSNYEREKQGNFTAPNKQFFPRDQNEIFNKKIGASASPPEFQERRGIVSPKSHQMSKTPGLQAFAARDPTLKPRRKQLSGHWKNGFSGPYRPLQAQNSNYRKSYRYFYPPNWAGGKGFIPKDRNPRLPFSNDQSSNHKTKEDSAKSSSHRSYGSKDQRNPRLYNGRHSPKVCDPCNNVPWVPLLNVPDSYRQQRTHITELHKAPSQDFNFDYKAFASDTQDILFPPVPLIPPLEPIYDGTISSSFGLPIGNIPTGHGMLAPINPLATKVNHYGANAIDFSNSLKIFPTQTVLDTNTFSQLSPVPIVPIHDSTQFYSTITNLVPPTTKTVDVSNVVLTIAEDGPAKITSDPGKLHTIYGKDLSSQSSSVVGFQSSHTQTKEYPLYPPYPPYSPVQNQFQNFGRLEIVKSIPLAEWQQTSSVKYPPASQVPPSNLPLQAQFPGGHSLPLQPQFPKGKLPLEPQYPKNNPPSQPQFSGGKLPLEQDSYGQKDSGKHSHSYSDLKFLVPPPSKRAESGTTFNASKTEVLPFLNPPKDLHFGESVKSSTVPQPLTSPSLNWLFSDHSTQATTPKTSEPAPQQFASDTHEIASIVNNELRPVSPYPFSHSSPDSTNSNASKGKKIQIIIPYTTKNKNGYDNNALESVQHEVFQTIQPPVSISTNENNSPRDFATSALPPSPDRAHQYLPEENRDKVIDGAPLISQTGELRKGEANLEDGHRYLSEMQHIIASNLRELLREEIEKSKSDQNYPLQNNIDNWTALEYSNHKTVNAKEPKEIISQALAVTSIPGTSISHLLLPSKKIPNEYFATTPLPVYDEPNTPMYNATNATVDSKPFTAKPYATTNVYLPTKSIKESIAELNQSKDHSGFFTHENHEKNYTDVGRGKVNHWGRLNENLVLPEARSRTRKLEATTATAWTSRFGDDSKVHIVTPVSSSTSKRNFTSFAYRRTTREVHSTEKSTTPMGTSRVYHTSALNQINSTKLEKVANISSPFNRRPIFRVANSSIRRQNHTRGVSDLSKTNANNTKVPDTSLSETLTFPSKELINFTKTNTSELSSINDVFPFRNQELPWEPKPNATFSNIQNGRQRKSLIKQPNLQRPKTKAVAADSS